MKKLIILAVISGLISCQKDLTTQTPSNNQTASISFKINNTAIQYDSGACTNAGNLYNLFGGNDSQNEMMFQIRTNNSLLPGSYNCSLSATHGNAVIVVYGNAYTSYAENQKVAIDVLVNDGKHITGTFDGLLLSPHDINSVPVIFDTAFITEGKFDVVLK